MATDIFEDFDERSQDFLGRLGMRDFEEVQSAFVKNTPQRRNSYVSPLYERNKPTDGSLLKLNEPLSFFSGDSGEVSDFSYTYRIILCDNGSQVLDTYQKTNTAANEMVIVCEKSDPNKSNLFGTFILVKYGEKYRKLVSDLKNNIARSIVSRKGSINGIRIDSFGDEVADNYSILKNNGVEIEKEKVEFAMNTELNITSSGGIMLKSIFGGLEDLINWVTEGLSEQLEKIKFTEKDYVPQKKDEELSFVDYLELLVELEVEAIKKAIDYAIPDEIEKVIAQSFDAALSKIKEYAKEKLPKGVLRLFEKAYATIQECLNFFKEGCKKLAELVGEALLLFKALLMGFVNGLISTIQMLLQLIGWLIKFISGINSYKMLTGENYREMQSKFEFVEDIIDLISEKASDFFTAVKTLFLDFSLDNMKEILKVFAGKASNLTPYHYAYYAGCFIFEVVLAVVLAIFTGGATAIAEAASMFEKVMATLKLVAREAFSVATMGIIDILQLFRVLITKFVQACKNGWAGFRDFLKKLMSNKTDDIAREEGKLLDDAGGFERRVEDLFDGLGGRLYTEKELKLLKIKLKTEYGVDLRLIDKEVGHQKLPVVKNGKRTQVRSRDLLKDWDRRGVVGKFDSGPPPIMILRSDNASELTVFHEKVHIEVWFNKMPKMHIVDEEKYVFEAIFKAREKMRWTDAELIDAYDYVNRIVRDTNASGKTFPSINNEFVEQLKWKKQFNF